MSEVLANPFEMAWRAAQRQLAVTALIAIVIGLWLVVILQAGVNSPSGDDYSAVLPFATKLKLGGAAGASLSDWWAQHFSHRIILLRALIWLDVITTGHVNIRHFQIFGCIAYIATWALVVSLVPIRNPSLLFSTSLLWFQPQGFSSFLIGLQSLSNIGVFLAAVLSIHLIVRASNAAFGLALGFGVISTFTQANGLIVIAAAMPIFIVRREWQRLALMVLVSAVVTSMYFVHFDFVKPAAQIVQKGHFELGEFMLNIFAMSGSIFNIGSTPFVFIVSAGAVLFVLALAVTILSIIDTGRHRLGVFGTFCILSISMAAVGRLGWGPVYMLQDRYRVYALSLCIIVVLGASVFLRYSRWLNVCCVGVTIVFGTLSYAHYYPALWNDGNEARTLLANIQLDDYLSAPDEQARATLQSALMSGVYSPPEILSEGDLVILKKTPVEPTKVKIGLQAQYSDALQSFAVSPIDPSQIELLTKADFLTIRHGGKVLLLQIFRQRNTFLAMARTSKIFSETSFAVVPNLARSFLNDPEVEMVGWQRSAGSIHPLFSANWTTLQ